MGEVSLRELPSMLCVKSVGKLKLCRFRLIKSEAALNVCQQTKQQQNKMPLPSRNKTKTAN